MGIEQPADRMGERVHGAEPFLEGDRAHARRGQHVRPRGEIPTILDRPLKPAVNQADAFGGDAVGQGMKARRAQRLKGMREGVHAGPGGELARQAERKLGVGDHLARQHARVEDDAASHGCPRW